MQKARSQQIAAISSLLLLLGLALSTAVGAQRGPRPIVRTFYRVPPPTQVNIALSAGDATNGSDTEPSIAVNPRNPLEIAVVSFSGNWGAGGVSAPIWMSSDGGLTWTRRLAIPEPAGAMVGPKDQKVAYDSLGNLHIAELGVDAAGTNHDYIYRTVAGVYTAGASFGDDQPHLEVARSNVRSCLGQVYSPWLNFGLARQRSMVTQSPDAGVTVNDHGVGNNASFDNRTTRIAIGVGGHLFVVYKTREGNAAGMFEDAHFRVSRSDDCGTTWDANGAGGVSVHGTPVARTFFTASWGNSAKGKVARARSSDGWIAARANGDDIYVVYVHRDSSNFGQIYVARSTDLGVTWTTRRVTSGSRHSAFPEVAVADNGTVGVLYVDFDDSGDTTLFRHRFARSFDNGATWTTNNLQTMNPTSIANATDGFLWGDYEGLTASGNQFYGVYTGDGPGRAVRQLDPIFFTASAVRTILPGCIVSRLCVQPTMGPQLVIAKCVLTPCMVIDPIPQNCLRKFECGGCPPGGLCPPWFHFYLDYPELKGVHVTLHEPDGTPAQSWHQATKTGEIISFRPKQRYFTNGKLGGYFFAIDLGDQVDAARELKIPMSLKTSASPIPEKR